MATFFLFEYKLLIIFRSDSRTRFSISSDDCLNAFNEAGSVRSMLNFSLRILNSLLPGEMRFSFILYPPLSKYAVPYNESHQQRCGLLPFFCAQSLLFGQWTALDYNCQLVNSAIE